MKNKNIFFSIMLLILAGPLTPQARVFMSLEAALAQSFPQAEIKKETVFLTADQVAAIEADIKQKLERKIVYVYRAYQDDQLIGTAYFDKHRVRTLPETLMVVIAPDHTVQQLRVLVFAEPLEYLPRDKWYEQFTGKKLTPELRLGREIDGVTGATLTARATTRAVRQALAVHRVLQQSETTP